MSVVIGAINKFWWMLFLVLILHQEKNHVKSSDNANEELDAQVQTEEGKEFLNL